jgi:hypothetical protein
MKRHRLLILLLVLPVVLARFGDTVISAKANSIDCSTLTLSPQMLLDGIVGTAYNETISATGGISPYTFNSVGNLPAGLILDSTGTLSGTPTIPGSFTFTATVTDSSDCKANKVYTITITSPIQCDKPTFSTSLNIPAGLVAQPTVVIDESALSSVVVEDFNSDGNLDLAVADLPADTISILLGNGMGNFGAPTKISVGNGPKFITLGDFNRDGKPDLAVASFTFVTILLGNGLGGFGSQRNFPLDSLAAYSISVGDFNEDGKLDLAVANLGSNNVSILLGDGTGSFGAAVNIPVGNRPKSVTSGDFNGDGKLDLAVANENSNNVSVLLGTGTGSFGPATNFSVGSLPQYVTSGDFNRDGKQDLAVANSSSSSLSILLGDGSGSFGATTNFTGSGSNYVAVGDFNGDGNLDLALTIAITSAISVLLGDGAGNFSAATNFVVGNSPVSIAVRDLDKNGTLDLAVANEESNDISILLNSCGCLINIILSPSTLLNGTAGTAYNQTLTASGGKSPYSFAVTSGSLPAGLALSSSGLISGTPTLPGSFTFTITATDASGCTGMKSYTLTINCATITLSPATLPDGTVGATYNQTITASSGTAPYTFAVTSGALPPGITLSSAGLLSGTPTSPGSFPFTVTATDANGCTGSRSYTVLINCATITLSPATLPGGTVGAVYNQTITASGGTAPYTFAVTSGTLPPGLTLSSTGLLSGTPTTAGSFNFTVTATDANGCTGSREYALVILSSPPPTIAGFSPSSGIAGDSITIAGTEFIGANAVRFGNESATFTVISNTQITATVPTTAITGPISVITSKGTAISSTSFTILKMPTVTGFTPLSGAVGTSVTITGTNLPSVTEVRFNGASAGTPTVVSATSIRTTVPAGAITGKITVINRASPQGVTSATTFKVLPKITGFMPASGIAGESVTITGTNLKIGNTNPTVKFGAVTATVISSADTEVVAAIPSTALTGKITVATADGTAISAINFTVIKRPTITALTPAIGAVGTSITITGTNLSNLTEVKFNGVSASPITVVSATSIKVNVPMGATTGKVTATNRAGTATSTALFKVLPKINGFTPTSGIVGESVTITGLNLKISNANPTVKFGAAIATVISASDSEVVVTIPSTAFTGKIMVSTMDGTATSATDFIVIKIPTVTAFTPAMGAVGASVTISGANLSSVTEVQFNGVSAGAPTVISATSVKIIIPMGATTGKVSVTNRAGTTTSTGIFKVPPKIMGFAPGSGIAGESATIRGTNLKVAGTNPTVKFGNGVATVTSATDVEIVATIPVTAITGKIIVTTVDGTATSLTDFIVIKAPTITSFTPAMGAVGASVTISGTNLNSVTEVQFNGTSAGAPTVISSTSIRATVPVGATTGKISVMNRAGAALSFGIFKVLPKITSFTPTNALPGESIAIIGTNFTGATAVRFGSVSAVIFTVDSDTQITAAVPATAITGKVSVITPSGTGISTVNFIVVRPPTIASFTPASGKIGAIVTIAGANLSSVTEVQFNGVSVGAPQVVSATSIKATVPAGAITGKIAVINRAGTAMSTSAFTVLP